MEQLNLRKSITRTLIITEVFAEHGENQYNYIVIGKTTPMKELKKVMSLTDCTDIPKIVLDERTEKRAISIDNFIKHSTIVIDEEIENEEQIIESEEN